MNTISWRRWLLVGVGFTLALGLAVPSPAVAAWSSGGQGSASTLTDVMPPGNQPSASVSGTSVTLRWMTAVFPGNRSVTGYAISRYNAITGARATVGAGCSGSVTTTTCTELNVPSGSWAYTDSPVQGNWTGAQSATSATVAIP